MAQLTNTIVTGKLAVTGKIYENGTAIDAKFASAISWNADAKKIAILKADGTELDNVTLPAGKVTVANTSISNLTIGSTATNSQYTISGSQSISPEVTTAGWVTSSNITPLTINASGTVAQSKVKYKRANASSYTDYTAINSIDDITPGSVVYISAGYYPLERTISIGTADVSGEASSGSITLKGTIGDSSSILQTSSNSTTGSYTVTFTPGTNTFTAGWINSAPTGSAITRYITKGKVTTKVEGSNPSVALKKDGSFVNATNMTNYGITSGITAPSGTDGTNYLTLTLTQGNVTSQTITATPTTSAGYVTSDEVSGGTKSVGASLTGGTNYYVPIVSPAFTGGGVSSSVTYNNDQTNATLEGTNNSGIAITVTPAASRSAVTYNGARKGLINIANGATASAKVNSTNGTAVSKYLKNITVASGKTLNQVTLGGGTISSLYLSANSTITNITADGSKTLTITNFNQAGMVLNIASNNGDIKIKNSTSGNGGVWLTDNTSGATARKLTNASGNLLTTSITSSSVEIEKTLDASKFTISDNFSGGLAYAASQPDSGHYITIGSGNNAFSETIKSTEAISAGWLDAQNVGTTLAESTITVNGQTKYIVMPDANVSGSSITTSVTTGNSYTNVSYTTAASTSGYTEYFVTVGGTGKTINSTAGWLPKSTSSEPSAKKTTSTKVYLKSGAVSLSSSVTTSPSVTMTTSYTTNANTNFGVTNTQPTTGDGTYITMTATNSKSADGKVSTTTSTTAGYVTSSNVEASKDQSIAPKYTASQSFYMPIKTPAFDGGTLSGGGLTQSGNDGGGLSWGNSNATISDTNNGISVSVTRAAFSNKVTRAKVTRGAVLYNGAVHGAVNIADNAEALAADSMAATGSTVSLGSTTTTKYISGVTVPSGKAFSVSNAGTTNVTSNTGTLKYETNWVITKDSSNNLTFTYSA